MIEIIKYSDLKKDTKDYLDTTINDEFGHIPIVSETKWATPDWTILYYEDDNITTFYNIIERNVLIDNNEVRVAGINNVITPKVHRGKGYASKTLKSIASLIFDELECKVGLLFCADALIPFYERLGWYIIDCSVFFDQPDGEKKWMANTMLLTQGDKMHPNKINLNGLPW